LFAEGATKAEVKSIIIGLGAKSIKDLDIKGLRALIEKLKEPVVEQVEDEVESQEEVLAETKSLCKELFDKGIDKRDVKSIITDLGAKSIKDLDIKGLRALREKLEKIQDTIYRRDHHMSI
jgi:hypothetical protein